jgi:spore coat polysaccharide biosynthesis protein SpsF
MDKWGIIVQVRMGSTRMPGKVLKPFYGKKSIFNLIIERLLKVTNQITVATTINYEDNVIEENCRSIGIECFRGSENDVLSRFIEVADKNSFKKVIRICADNPFIDIQGIQSLIKYGENNPEQDYVSFYIGDTPVIRTHYGFWAEWVSVKALKQAHIKGSTFHKEHVTNYIYEHPKYFNIMKLPVEQSISNMQNLRLTVDTESDFTIAKSLYSVYAENNNLVELIQFVKTKPEIFELMKENIQAQRK